MPPQSPLQPGQLVAGKYRIVRALGAGPCTVYEAENVLTSTRVALKWLMPQLVDDPDAVARMKREAQAAARVRHPNIVDIYDVERDGKALVLVMEYLEGETLASLIARRSGPVAELVSIVVDIAHAVAAVHAQGIVHGDITASNIFLARQARARRSVPKLLDFGISKLGACAGGAAEASRRVLGTPAYMAPEQMLGEPIDGRTDVYALGVVLYEALSGKLPHDGASLSERMVRAHTHEAASPRLHRPELPDALEAIVMEAIAREPARRIASAETLAARLEPFAEEALGMARGERVRSRSLRRGLPLVLAVGAALALYAARCAEERVPALPPTDRAAVGRSLQVR